MMEVVVDNEETGQQIRLQLSVDQFERAQRDPEYLNEIINENRLTDRTGEIQNELSVESEQRSLFIWNDQCIFLLLTLYEEHKEDFQSMRHKTVYDNIARKMRDVENQYQVTGGQCQSKIASLKKHYKKIVDHNNTSGNGRANWPYYDRMNELFGSTGWANPVALASEEGPTTDATTPAPEIRKRKLDHVLEEFRKDIKQFKEERAKVKQENFNKFLELKERHHRDKMELLKSILSNNNNNIQNNSDHIY